MIGAVGRLGAVRQPLPGERRAGPAAAATPAGPADAAVADAPARLAAARRRQSLRLRSRSSSRPTGRSSGRLRPARRCGTSWRPSSGARSGSSAWRRRAPRRSPRRSCSTTSPPTCTRATRRCWTGARRRWRWTATCCGSCWAPRSCASCSMPTRWPSWSSSCRRSTASSERRRPPMACTTCCAGWATSRTEEVAPGCAARTRLPGVRAARQWLEALQADRRARPGAHRRAAALDRAGGRRAATATRSGWRLPPGRAGAVPGARPRTPWRRCWRAGRAATGRS